MFALFPIQIQKSCRVIQVFRMREHSRHQRLCIAFHRLMHYIHFIQQFNRLICICQCQNRQKSAADLCFSHPLLCFCHRHRRYRTALSERIPFSQIRFDFEKKCVFVYAHEWNKCFLKCHVSQSNFQRMFLLQLIRFVSFSVPRYQAVLQPISSFWPRIIRI